MVATNQINPAALVRVEVEEDGETEHSRRRTATDNRWPGASHRAAGGR